MNRHCETSDLLIFSHLRWDFVFQRPQHLLSRFAKYRRVYYFEEPVFGLTDIPRLHLRETTEGVQVVVPYLPESTKPEDIEGSMRDLVDELIFEEDLSTYALWYYSPMSLGFSRHLKPAHIVYDKMDKHSLSQGASQEVVDLENELMERADLVFTAGQSLYEATQHMHPNIHSFPGSIDYHHFAEARSQTSDPEDQAYIPHPRLGFYGVIDERFNTDMLKAMAQLRPDFHFVIIGPVENRDEKSLPRSANIHYLGKKDYSELPQYLAGWDCAIMPFALNDSTRFISPTKTPEFLASGTPVVATSIKDVVSPYADEGLIHIADTATDFVAHCEFAMKEKSEDSNWLMKVDRFLAPNSWDLTFRQMAKLEMAISRKETFGPGISEITPIQISAAGVH